MDLPAWNRYSNNRHAQPPGVWNVQATGPHAPGGRVSHRESAPVTRTLHTYITKDLMRVGALALIAFTLVLTIFSVVEPLRKEGLAPQEVLRLFGYTLPVMLSLTLPIASLFATTIVYGRLSQDNEILACRASGISVVSLMRPAFVLAILVTLASLLLSFLITPHMAARMTLAAKANIRNIVYHKLQAEGSFDYKGMLVHADAVDPERDIIQGIVVVDERKKRQGRPAVWAASRAYVRFGGADSDSIAEYVTFTLRDPTPMSADARQLVQPEIVKDFRLPLPKLLLEKPSWYDWGKLNDALRNPSESQDIRHMMGIIRRLMKHDRMANEITEAIRAGKPYTDLRADDAAFIVRAPTARQSKPGQVVLEAVKPHRAASPVEQSAWPALARLTHDSLLGVEVFEIRQGTVRRRVVGTRAEVLPTEQAGTFGNQSLLQQPALSPSTTIEVTGEPVVTLFTRENPIRVRRAEWSTAEPKLPERIRREVDQVDLKMLFDNPEGLHLSPALQKEAQVLKRWGLERLRRNLLSELNARSAYSLSCFLLVVLGGALGVLFRGGQVISAFTLSVAPAAIVIVLILMGKQMATNPDVPVNAGLASIWAGLLLLLAANLVAYRRLLKH